MQTLDTRLTRLEQAQPLEEGLTIIRRLIALGHLDVEMDYINDGDGKSWTRQPGEAEATFIDRASSTAAGNSWGVKRLIGRTLGVQHATH